MRYVGLVWLWISLSCSLMYECCALDFILFSVGLMLAASDWGTVEEFCW